MNRKEKQVQITVKDRGKGFDAKKLNLKKGRDGGFGLFNLQERFDLLGGSLELHSKPGNGTTITLMAPLGDEETPLGDEEKRPG